MRKIIPGFIQLISLCPIWAYTLGFKKKVERLRRGTQRTKMGSYGGKKGVGGGSERLNWGSLSA